MVAIIATFAIRAAILTDVFAVLVLEHTLITLNSQASLTHGVIREPSIGSRSASDGIYNVDNVWKSIYMCSYWHTIHVLWKDQWIGHHHSHISGISQAIARQQMIRRRIMASVMARCSYS